MINGRLLRDATGATAVEYGLIALVHLGSEPESGDGADGE